MKKGCVQKEKEITEVMIRLYCEKNHYANKELFQECAALNEYAQKR